MLEKCVNQGGSDVHTNRDFDFANDFALGVNINFTCHQQSAILGKHLSDNCFEVVYKRI